MQVVIAAPESKPGSHFGVELTRKICGVALLERTLVTAQRAGATEILLIWPDSLPVRLAKRFLQSPLLRKNGKITLLLVKGFDPSARASWAGVWEHLEERFVWLPWNWVTYPRALAKLPESEHPPENWSTPAWVSRKSAIAGIFCRTWDSYPEGIAVGSFETVPEAERFLVAHSGKVLDGIHTSFNRRLCRPAVRWMSHTDITPNQVTFAGVVVALLSGLAFFGGSYWWYVVGALLCYLAGLFDEMDGMLARIKFSDSPFGTWLEGFADGLSYIFLFGGITVGLYRQYGSRELWVGAALLIGTVLSIAITSFQRKRATTADRPNEYLGKFYNLLEKDSANWISRAVRHVQAFQKRGVMIFYIVIFTVLGGLPLLFYLATLGSNLTWTLALYYNRRFFKRTNIALPGVASQEAS